MKRTRRYEYTNGKCRVSDQDTQCRKRPMKIRSLNRFLATGIFTSFMRAAVKEQYLIAVRKPVG